MGKKAEKWKAKYNELLRITEGYIRHLHDTHSKLRAGEQRDCDSNSCEYDHSGFDTGAERIKELEDRVDEVENELLSKDQELAEEIEAREIVETEAEKAIISLEDEKNRLEYRADDLERALKDVLACVENARVLRATVSELDPGQRVHLFETEWNELVESCAEATQCLREGSEGQS